MNAFLRTWAMVALVTATSFAAPPLHRVQVEPPRVKREDLPVFPPELLQLGEREGYVRMAISVDVTGKMDDYLVLAYTHPEFARVTVAALKKWTFEPATLAGTPVPSATEIAVKFETQGTIVVSMTGTDAMSTHIHFLVKERYNYRPYALRELDAIPTPLAAPSPVYPHELARQGHVGEVAVDFYIDETGSVRMPSVNADQDSELAAIALAALHNWKFEPPVCKGKPVLVKANQVFRFTPGKDANVTIRGSNAGEAR